MRILYDKVGISDESSANKFISWAIWLSMRWILECFNSPYGCTRQRGNRTNTTFSVAQSRYGALIAIFDPKDLRWKSSTVYRQRIGQHRRIENIIGAGHASVPAYIKLAARQVLQEVYAGKRAVPTSSVGVGLTSILTANERLTSLKKERNYNSPSLSIHRFNPFYAWAIKVYWPTFFWIISEIFVKRLVPLFIGIYFCWER